MCLFPPSWEGFLPSQNANYFLYVGATLLHWENFFSWLYLKYLQTAVGKHTFATFSCTKKTLNITLKKERRDYLFHLFRKWKPMRNGAKRCEEEENNFSACGYFLKFSFFPLLFLLFFTLQQNFSFLFQPSLFSRLVLAFDCNRSKFLQQYFKQIPVQNWLS